jgi:hypothetical protein
MPACVASMFILCCCPRHFNTTPCRAVPFLRCVSRGIREVWLVFLFAYAGAYACIPIYPIISYPLLPSHTTTLQPDWAASCDVWRVPLRHGQPALPVGGRGLPLGHGRKRVLLAPVSGTKRRCVVLSLVDVQPVTLVDWILTCVVRGVFLVPCISPRRTSLKLVLCPVSCVLCLSVALGFPEACLVLRCFVLCCTLLHCAELCCTLWQSA